SSNVERTRGLCLCRDENGRNNREERRIAQLLITQQHFQAISGMVEVNRQLDGADAILVPARSKRAQTRSCARKASEARHKRANSVPRMRCVIDSERYMLEPTAEDPIGVEVAREDLRDGRGVVLEDATPPRPQHQRLAPMVSGEGEHLARAPGEGRYDAPAIGRLVAR